MAKVEMDLAELDKIREDNKQLATEVAKRNDMLAEKDKEIAEVKADKRTVKVTTKIEPSLNYQSTGFDFFGISSERNTLVRKLSNILGNSSKYDVYNHISNEIGGVVDNFIRKTQMDGMRVSSYKETSTTEYVNMDDVISQIREEVEAKVATELGTAKAAVSKLTTELSEVTAKHKSEINDLTTKHNNLVNFNYETAQVRYNKLQQEFMDFREEKDTRTLEQKVKDLEAELVKYKNKKWYQKIK